MSAEILRQAGYLPKTASVKSRVKAVGKAVSWGAKNPVKVLGKALGGRNYAGLLFLPLMVGKHPGMLNPSGVTSAVRAPIKRVRVGGDPMTGKDLLQKHVLRQLQRRQ